MTKEDVKILLELRKELREDINKKEKQYTAIGNVLEELFKYKQREEDDGR